MAYLGYDGVQWERTAATTLADHIRKEEVATLRTFQFGALLEANGRVTYNHGGNGFDWPVQWKLHSVQGYTGAQPRSFSPTNQWKTANLPYRGYIATDAIDLREVEQNKGEAAIVKVMDGMTNRLLTSIKQGLGVEFFVDGNATGNEQKWHGLDSMFGSSGSVNISDGTTRSYNAADKVYWPSDTYAGLSTYLGQYGGENTSGTPWPQGVADAEYDFWSPLKLIAVSTAYAPSTHTFAGQGDEVMRYGILHAQRNSTMDGQITNIWLDRTNYNDFLNLIDGKEQINITAENGLRALGFRNVVVFDGVEVSWETGVPSGMGYGLNIANVELRCMKDSLFSTEGPEWDMDRGAYKALAYTLSNLKFNSPRNFLKIDTVTAA